MNFSNIFFKSSRMYDNEKKKITFSTWEKGNCWNNLGNAYPIIKKGFLDHSSFSKPSKAYHLSINFEIKQKYLY